MCRQFGLVRFAWTGSPGKSAGHSGRPTNAKQSDCYTLPALKPKCGTTADYPESQSDAAESPLAELLSDFLGESLRLAKIVRDKSHGRALKSELNDNAMNYKNDPLCHDLIFFIYDPDTYIESPAGLRAELEGDLIHKNKAIRIHCVIQK
jgi:hypothetical protein